MADKWYNIALHPDLHHALKVEAARQQVTLRDLIIRYLNAQLAQDQKKST